MNLAYKYVAITVMLGEINFIGARLNLPIHFPVTEADLRKILVVPSTVLNIESPGWPNFGGRLDTEKFSFCFSDDGRLRYIVKLHPWGTMSVPVRNDMLVTQSAIIDTNDAYGLATNWLTLMCVNVGKLEKETPIVVEHEFRWKDPNDQSLGREYFPLFRVTWGGKQLESDVDAPKINIEIDGRTKEIIALRLEDDSVSDRPKWPIKEPDELLGISDLQFVSYSAQERMDLVMRFAAFTHDVGKVDTSTPLGTSSSFLSRAQPTNDENGVSSTATNAPTRQESDVH
jgi:hypothetical protein